jgi:hypothetical protein
MKDNESRAIGVNVRTPIEELEGSLEAIQNDNGLGRGHSSTLCVLGTSQTAKWEEMEMN